MQRSKTNYLVPSKHTINILHVEEKVILETHNGKNIKSYLDIYCSLKHEVSQNGNLLPFHKSDSQCQKR